MDRLRIEVAAVRYRKGRGDRRGAEGYILLSFLLDSLPEDAALHSVPRDMLFHVFFSQFFS